jgi:hypothetical protein
MHGITALRPQKKKSGINLRKLCRSRMQCEVRSSIPTVQHNPTLTKWHSYGLKLKDSRNKMSFCRLINRLKSTSFRQMIDGGDSAVISLRRESGLCVNSFKQNTSSMT